MSDYNGDSHKAKRHHANKQMAYGSNSHTTPVENPPKPAQHEQTRPKDVPSAPDKKEKIIEKEPISQ
ncbi:hypothetical protein [Acinetobacter sp. ANC 4648]|uniref:hypothetical protein n=1 Tax=Acinetobacter sp. ANC 4648 TaxID=1977875 RepID=UPI000A3455F5|nr:hypothetical protein [Acinetobacter sp. ANC 4648]OTG82170.1 hypothetical protein B9T27_07915 [Acinetobacter sp. ANC 4648]